ncbi:MAG: threonine synthase [Parachlamydiaceae bacterium]|nr:threonine synthase [Parachlamydiaceae bacterium]
MHFYSTNNKNIRVSLEDAVMKGLAEDGGLFMPDHIPHMPETFFNQIGSLSFQEIAFEVGKMFLEGIIPVNEQREIVSKAFNFEAPLKELSSDIYALELFHGPTLSFKDFGGRYMAQLMGYFMRHKNQTLNILVATSGDTGSAIAQAFFNVPGIRVWILYPEGKVSWSQEKQLTTMGGNITALEVVGSFDDCQKLVKQAFSDNVLRKKVNLTSANSINIARLIPQSFYYIYAYAQLKDKNKPMIISVPCGNFGNLTAGLLAQRIGLPVAHFMAATNINDTVPKYLHTGIFEPHLSKHTLSNAMDVGNPSNFARMLDLYDHQWKKMGIEVTGISYTDDQTKIAMQELFSKYGYLPDPHGAVAFLGLQSYMKNHQDKINGIFLETAHPAKFAEDVERITSQKVPIPKGLQDVLAKEKHSIKSSPNYDEFHNLLLTKYKE